MPYMQGSAEGSQDADEKQLPSGAGIMPSMHGMLSRMTSGSNAHRDLHSTRSMERTSPSSRRGPGTGEGGAGTSHSLPSSADAARGHPAQPTDQSLVHFSSVAGALCCCTCAALQLIVHGATCALSRHAAHEGICCGTRFHYSDGS